MEMKMVRRLLGLHHNLSLSSIQRIVLDHRLHRAVLLGLVLPEPELELELERCTKIRILS